MMGVEVPDGMVIDHINNDPWDNRWDNLRLLTQRENCRNRGASHGKSTNLPRCIFMRTNGTFYVQINSGSKESVEIASEWLAWAMGVLHAAGIYVPKNIKSNKSSGLPRGIHHTWCGGIRRGVEGRIHQGGLKSVVEATIWRNKAETLLFGEVLHQGGM